MSYDQKILPLNIQFFAESATPNADNWKGP